MARIEHPIPPLFDDRSRVLILGSFPSVKSREQGFFYGHPQNRFWRVISNIFEYPVPVTIEEKKALILGNHLALWDVIASCEIEGSSDSSIAQATANDLSIILNHASIGHIFLNGRVAEKLYEKYFGKTLTIPATGMPSTSPANASWSQERLCESWRIVRMST